MGSVMHGADGRAAASDKERQGLTSSSFLPLGNTWSLKEGRAWRWQGMA